MGFNDLGILLSCDLREAPGGKKGHDPLRFIGIDASPFSVAKSLVLAEMLRMLETKGQRVRELDVLQPFQLVLLSTFWCCRSCAVLDIALRPTLISA